MIDELKEVLHYKAGKLFWKRRTSSRAAVGQEAGCLEKQYGYWVMRYNGKQYKRGRLVYAMHHGYWPTEVDHIDLNKLNDKIENLREANRRENTVNRPKQNNNKSGYKGVSFYGYRCPNRPWRAVIKFKGRYKHLGNYYTPEEAAQVYCEAAKKLHGEFYCEMEDNKCL